MKRFEERRKRIEDRDPQFSILDPQLLRPAPPALDLSGASEADRYLSAFDNDRDLAPVVGIFQHALEACFVFQDIDVVEGDLTPGVFRTGPRGIGSEILTEDENFFCHKDLESYSLISAKKEKLQVLPSLCYLFPTEGCRDIQSRYRSNQS